MDDIRESSQFSRSSVFSTQEVCRIMIEWYKWHFNDIAFVYIKTVIVNICAFSKLFVNRTHCRVHID